MTNHTKIYRGTKFNARKKITDKKYLSISIIQFYIKCPSCSTEICFETSPAENDYRIVSGAKRAFTPWNNADSKVESEEQRLDRLEREQAEAVEDAMTTLEGKVYDAQQEKRIADALDEIQMRNARNEKTFKDSDGNIVAPIPDAQREAELLREEQDREDEEAAKRAFQKARLGGSGGRDEDGNKGVEGLDAAIEIVDEVVEEEDVDDDEGTVGVSKVPDKQQSMLDESGSMPPPPPPPTTSFKRGVKRKKDFGAALGIKKKASLV